MDSLVARTEDISLYIEFNLILGPRALDANRMQAGGQLRVVAGTATGGSLAAALRVHFNMDADVEAVFLADQIADFLFQTRWEEPYNFAFKTLKEYALDLPSRAKWQRASREEWAAIAMKKIVHVLPRLDLLHEIFLDVKDQATM